MKVVRLLAIRNGRLCRRGNNPGIHFSYSLSEPQVHSAARRIMSMKIFKDTFGNRTRALPACSAVLQSNLLPRDPREWEWSFVYVCYTKWWRHCQRYFGVTVYAKGNTLHKNLLDNTLRHVVLFRSSCLRDTTRHAMIQDREVCCDVLSSMF